MKRFITFLDSMASFIAFLYCMVRLITFLNCIAKFVTFLSCMTRFIIFFKKGITRFITFLNCMTRFMRLEVELWAWLALPEVPCRMSSMEILFFTAWYSIFCLVVSGQYTKISIYKRKESIVIWSKICYMYLQLYISLTNKWARLRKVFFFKSANLLYQITRFPHPFWLSLTWKASESCEDDSTDL